MADLSPLAPAPEFLDVPGVPGGRVAASGLSPEVRQRLMDAYAGGMAPPVGVPEAPPTATQLGNMRPSEPAPASPAMIDALGQARAGGLTMPMNVPDATDLGNMNPGQIAALPAAVRERALGQLYPPTSAAPGSPPAPAAPPSPMPGGPPQLPPSAPSGGPMGALAQASLGASSRPYGEAPGVPGASLGAKDFEAVAKAQAQSYEIGARAAAEKAGFVQEQARQLELQQADDAKRMADRNAFYDGETKKLQDLQTAAAKPGKKVDPGRLWANKSTPDKILAGIAVVLMGFGQGLQGRGGNDALTMIQKQIDDDVQLQKDEVADQKDTARAAVSGQMNLMSLARQHYQDSDSQLAAAKATGREIAAMQLDALAAKASGEQQKALIAQAAAGLRIEAGKYQDEVKARQFNQHIQGQQLGLQRMEAMGKLMGGKAPPQLPAGEATKVGDLDAALGMLKDIGAAHEKLGAGSSFAQWIGGTKSAQYKDQMKVATQVIGGILEGGKLTDKDYDRYLGMMPAAGDFSPTAMNKVMSIAALLSRKRDSNLAALQSAGYDTSRFAQSAGQKREKYGAVEH